MCGKNVLLIAPTDLNVLEKVEMANIKHPLDWFTLTKDDYVIERNRYLKLLPQMDQVKENNTYYLRVTITESKMFFNKISIKGI